MTKHIETLDALRGVAALSVVVYHLFEALAFANGQAEQHMFHGFLAVDFFFLLSGYVLSLAYDGRWSDKKFSLRLFMLRRIRRLQPTVLAGAVIGLVAYLAAGATTWEGVQPAPSTIALSFLLALFVLPVLSSGLDVRGGGELYPLNGPHWSLFFEYIGSFLYGLVLRRLPRLGMWVVTFVVMSALFLLASEQDTNTLGGWSYAPANMLLGFLRMLLGFTMGIFLHRYGWVKMKQMKKIPRLAFPHCDVLIVLFLCMPSLSAIDGNVFYQMACVVLLFPTILHVAAQRDLPSSCRGVLLYFGKLSYPLYAVHYPLIYLLIHLLQQPEPVLPVWALISLTGVASVLLGILTLHLWDLPVRRWLAKKK